MAAEAKPTLPGYQVAYERFTRLPLTVLVMTNVSPTNVDKLASDMAKLFFKHCGARRRLPSSAI